MDTSPLYRCAGDIIYNDQEPVPGHISDVQLKMYSETTNFLQYLKPLTPQHPYFFGQIRSLGKCLFTANILLFYQFTQLNKWYRSSVCW